VPVVIGSIEASLRRIAHWRLLSGGSRRSILLDSQPIFVAQRLKRHRRLPTAWPEKLINGPRSPRYGLRAQAYSDGCSLSTSSSIDKPAR
jgi:hypothetical protein